MSEDKSSNGLAAVWKNQPDEAPLNLEGLLNQRARELDSVTRSEILTSLGAALFFVAVLAWDQPVVMGDRIAQASLVAVVGWILLSLYWFRDQIWRDRPRQRDDLAVPGLEYYRKTLRRRRDHLRNAWLWHGPLLLTCTIFIPMLIWKKIIPYRGLPRVLPFVLLLAVWTLFGIMRRLRQARELQREIDEVESS